MKVHPTIMTAVLIIIASLLLLKFEKSSNYPEEYEIILNGKIDSTVNGIQAYGTAIYKVGFTQKGNSNNYKPSLLLFLESRIFYINNELNNTGKPGTVKTNEKPDKFTSVLLKYR
jgi:hypothetical protein